MKNLRKFSLGAFCVMLLVVTLSVSRTARADTSGAAASGAGATSASASSADVQRGYAEVKKVALLEDKTPDKAAAESASDDNAVNVYRHAPMVHTFARISGLPVETTARIFEFINFLILAIAVLWFVARALPKALRGRSARIQKNLVDARVATEDANRRLQDVEQRLAKLDTEIAGMKAQAEKETAADEIRIRTLMDEEQQRLVHAAEQEVLSVSANAQRRLKTLAADLILQYATQHVSVDTEADRSLVKSFVAELGSKGRKGMN